MGHPELRAATAMMWLASSSLTMADGTVAAAAYQAGRGRQALMGRADRVGDEPRLLVDFTAAPPALTVHGRSVGHWSRQVVSLMEREYRLARPRGRWLRGLRFTASVAGAPVLRVRERRRRNGTVRSFDVRVAADLDPVVALGLIVLEGRPDRMGVTPFSTQPS